MALCRVAGGPGYCKAKRKLSEIWGRSSARQRHPDTDGPVSHDAAEGLYRIVDAAYEKRSIALSSNLHPAGFDELMPKTLATATVDRLLHHAHVFQTSGDSIRLTCALDGKGVHPLH